MTTKIKERIVVAGFWLFVALITAGGTWIWGLWPAFGRIVAVIGGTFGQ